jgi:hypothetical protein
VSVDANVRNEDISVELWGRGSGVAFLLFVVEYVRAMVRGFTREGALK